MTQTALFGAGQIGASLHARLTSERIAVDCFLDNHKTGTFCDLPVLHPDSVDPREVEVYIATLDFYPEIERQLKAGGFRILGSREHLIELFTANRVARNPLSIDFDVDFAIRQMEYFCVDLVNGCQLECPCCARGVRAVKNTGERMSLETFERVCHRILQDGFKKVALYNWTEPFLNKTLDEYIAVFRAIVGEDAYLSISSNLSLPEIPRLHQVMEAGADELLVSVSGFTQATHEIYHKGSRIEFVKRHLEECAGHRSRTKVFVKYLNFGYNEAELPLFEAWAKEHGLCFTSTMGFGSPLTLHEQPTLAFHEAKLKEHLYDKWDVAKYIAGIGKFCDSSLCLDHDAQVYLCCRFPNLPQFKIGNYLTDSTKEILTARQLHPFCTHCDAKKFGGAPTL